MKKNIIRLTSAVLALVLVLGAAPLAMAACDHSGQTTTTYAPAASGSHTKIVTCDSCSEIVSQITQGCINTDDDGLCDNCEAAMPADDACGHTNTTVSYEANNDGSHQKLEICNAATCGKTVFEDIEYCMDMDADDECDRCNAAMPDHPLCDHANTTGRYTANGDGTHTISISCKSCFTSLLEKEEACEDEDRDLKCDSCGAAMEEVSDVKISCEEHGTSVSSRSQLVTFSISGVNTDDITWSFTADGSALPELSSNTGSGTSASVNVTATNGRGAARIVATASWAGGSKSAAAYVSFCTRASHTVTVKDGISAFRFMQTKVLDSVSNLAADKVEGYSLYRLMVDGCGTYIKLYEDSPLNERVGMITYKTTGSTMQYDPEGYNVYGINQLNNLIFTVQGEGTYKLKYEIQEKVANNLLLPTTRGTINIVVGQPGDADVNIIYRTNGEPVSFSAQDFTDYWLDNAVNKKEAMNYVKFSIDDRAYGPLYLDGTQRGMVLDAYKFKDNITSKDDENTYKLTGVTYLPDPDQEKYTEKISFTVYGKSNSVVRGTVTIIVGGAMEFTDVAKEDWFYEEVSYVFTEGIMTGISDTEFDPQGTLTRGMVVTMLHRAAGKPAAASKDAFTDVPADTWYTEAVAWAAENGIVNGMGDGLFAPEANITREQLAAILYRYADQENMDINCGAEDLTGFVDDNRVSGYAIDAMKWAVYSQLMNGDNNYLNPQTNATRAQAAAAFARLLNK